MVSPATFHIGGKGPVADDGFRTVVSFSASPVQPLLLQSKPSNVVSTPFDSMFRGYSPRCCGPARQA